MTPPTFCEHTPNQPSSGRRASKNFTNEVGCTPLGYARLTISLEEVIPNSRRTETQTFVLLDLLFYFILGKTGAEKRREIARSKLTRDSGENRNVGGGDSPTFREADPELALAAQDAVVVEGAFEFDGDVGVIPAEGDDIETEDFSAEIGCGGFR